MPRSTDRLRPPAIREAEARLFNEPDDPITIIKWKDVYGRLENTADACRRVANVLLGVRSRLGM
jgi:uncharacterized protein Yka (UPF0111/DUF47 family)